jgi:hypothetical protein
MENFDKAEEILGSTKNNNVKFAKLIYLRGLASKRISVEKSMEKFEEALMLFSKILKTD